MIFFVSIAFLIWIISSLNSSNFSTEDFWYILLDSSSSNLWNKASVLLNKSSSVCLSFALNFKIAITANSSELNKVLVKKLLEAL